MIGIILALWNNERREKIGEKTYTKDDSGTKQS
jgi:hypothetical protein